MVIGDGESDEQIDDDKDKLSAVSKGMLLFTIQQLLL